MLVAADAVSSRQLVHDHVDAAFLQISQFVLVDSAHPETIVSHLLLVVCVSDRALVHANLVTRPVSADDVN